MTGCRMNPGCDSLKKRRYAVRLAAIYADQASVPNEVCHFNILSINRVHEVAGHFLASVLDKNDPSFNKKIQWTDNFPPLIYRVDGRKRDAYANAIKL